jgi:hypothetical protein
MFSSGDLVVDYDKYPDFIGIVYYINNDELYSVKVKFYKNISTAQKNTEVGFIDADTYTITGKRLNEYPDVHLEHLKIENLDIHQKIEESQNTKISIEDVSTYGVIITLENGFSFYRDNTGTLLEIKPDRIKL